MSETFAELFEQSLNDIDMTPGAIVDATIVAIEPDFVIVNAGLKSEGAIPNHNSLTNKVSLQSRSAILSRSRWTQLKMVLVPHACLAKKEACRSLDRPGKST